MSPHKKEENAMKMHTNWNQKDYRKIETAEIQEG